MVCRPSCHAADVAGLHATLADTTFGEEAHPLTIPAAYQVPKPFGSSVGGADPMFFQFKAAAEFDSWLSVGITQGDSGGKIGTVGMKFDAWTAVTALSVSDGAIFWMNPDSGPGHSAPKALGSKCCVGDAIVLAQLTVPKAYHGTATMNIGGRSVHGSDYREFGVSFSIGQ